MEKNGNTYEDNKQIMKIKQKPKPQFTINRRADGRIELVCEHGVGHTVYAPNNNYIHGCDSCCRRLLFQVIYNNFEYLVENVLPLYDKDFKLALNKYIKELEDLLDIKDNIEVWKDIPGYRGLYQASTFGHIKRSERILKTRPCTKYGHLAIGLWENGNRKTYKVHRLIILTFVGPCPQGMETRHLDGNASNNKLDNLRYGTRSENELDKIRYGTRFQPDNRGEKCTTSKLTTQQVLQIRKLYAEQKISYKQLARKFNISASQVHNIINRKQWTHI